MARRTNVCFIGLFLAGVAAAPTAWAQAPDPFAAMNAAGEAFQKDGIDAATAILKKAIDETRVNGEAPPAMAPAFGMYADSLRNSGDLAGALAITEEGLALVASDPAPDPIAKTLLTVSHAYALGALGRYSEAIAAADTALPGYAEAFGSDDTGVHALEGEKRIWVDARRNDLDRRATAAWEEADRLEVDGDVKTSTAALAKRREAVKLLEEAGDFPKRLASALATLASTASTAGELAEAREAAVRAIGMVDVLKDEPPSEIASLFLIVGNVFYLQGRFDTAASLQGRAILLYAEGRDDDGAFDRFLGISLNDQNPFAGYDTGDDMRPLLRRALLELGDTCRQIALIDLADDAYARANELIDAGDTETASTVAARFAAAAATGGDALAAKKALRDALTLAEKGTDEHWKDLLRFWIARVDMALGDPAEGDLAQSAERYLQPLDVTDLNAIRIRRELTKSLRQSPPERRDWQAILAAARGAKAGVVARLDRQRQTISSDADLDRQNAREIFSLFVSAAWEAETAPSPKPSAPGK